MKKTKKTRFYLGNLYDPIKGKRLAKPSLYDPADLTTHAFVTGMTGSGKTGLCIGILEEAALQGIPAIVVDPKGDLTNLLLHFPELNPEDFKPWIDPEAARRKEKSLSVLAEETARLWRDGLADWGLGREQLISLQNAVEFAIYTPGSSAGIPVNIISSFQAPDLPWDENKDVLREDIASTVTGLLGLVGMNDIDPLRSREHILLANILENAWSRGRSLDLTELILQVQTPPFSRLGAFSLKSFFPEKERFDLAMLLNNFLAAPSFQTWIEGQPLDIPALLHSPDGRPRHSVFYLAHLSEAERMFFVTLLFAAIEAWMRGQRGTSRLRALIYFDEILGYLPPVANPPSRSVMLRMLKQARAFGVGLLLATQNPVDLNYKALSNAGTWIIGRLQTERDKMRLLDGLQGAMGDLDITEYDRMISGLKKRVFLMHNVHQSGPQIFHTRWALNFLAGPMTRSQIPALNRLVSAEIMETGKSSAKKKALKTKPTGHADKAPIRVERGEELGSKSFSATRPAVPGSLQEYFIPNDLGVEQAVKVSGLKVSTSSETEGILYQPALLAQAEVRYLSRRYQIEYTRQVAALVTSMERQLVKWDDHVWHVYRVADLHSQPQPHARFSPLLDWLSEGRGVKTLEKDFVDWVYRSGTIHLRANQTLKVYAEPQTTSAEFRELCSQAAREKLEVELDKLETKYDKKLDTLERRIKRQKLEVEEQEDEVSQRRMEELGTHGELLISIFSKRRRSLSSSLTKRRLSKKARADLEQEIQEFEDLEKQLKKLEKESNREIQDIKDKWAEAVDDESEIPLAPYKKDIFVEAFCVAWMPYYLVRVGDRVEEVPAFTSG